MTQIDLSSYRDIYLQTAKEYVNSLLEACSELKQNLSDKDALDSLHIGSHSIRSQSQVMGYTNTANLAGIIEKIARKVLDGKHKMSQELVGNMKEGAVEISLSLDTIEKENKEKDLSMSAKKLEENFDK